MIQKYVGKRVWLMSIVLAWQSQAQNNQDAQSGVECSSYFHKRLWSRVWWYMSLYEHSEDWGRRDQQVWGPVGLPSLKKQKAGNQNYKHIFSKSWLILGLLVMTSSWKLPNCLSIPGWAEKLRWVHIMNYYRAVSANNRHPHTTAWEIPSAWHRVGGSRLKKVSTVWFPIDRV